MSDILIKRIRKNREFKKKVGAFTFLCRRPTDQEANDIKMGETFPNICQRFVIGWENVTENDVIGGGGTEPVEFDPVLWREWCADRKDFWSMCKKHEDELVEAVKQGKEPPDNDACQLCNPLPKAILDAYKTHTADMAAAAKNSLPGSNDATPNA